SSVTARSPVTCSRSQPRIASATSWSPSIAKIQPLLRDPEARLAVTEIVGPVLRGDRRGLARGIGQLDRQLELPLRSRSRQDAPGAAGKAESEAHEVRSGRRDGRREEPVTHDECPIAPEPTDGVDEKGARDVTPGGRR